MNANYDKLIKLYAKILVEYIKEENGNNKTISRDSFYTLADDFSDSFFIDLDDELENEMKKQKLEFEADNELLC